MKPSQEAKTSRTRTRHRNERRRDGGPALADQGVKHIFGYPGGAVLPIYDALFRERRSDHVLVRHEQGAVHAAEAMRARPANPEFALVTSGPGATNAVTGLTDALMDFDSARRA